jgi:hypothetical protein
VGFEKARDDVIWTEEGFGNSIAIDLGGKTTT